MNRERLVAVGGRPIRTDVLLSSSTTRKAQLRGAYTHIGDSTAAASSSRDADAALARLDALSPEARIGVLAYAAGVIDSDGSISILRDTHAMRHGRATQASFSERVTIRQIEPEAVDLLYSFFGGCRSVIAGRREHQQPLQSVQLLDRQASRLLADVVPYLRIKKQQALLCLSLRGIKEESRRARFAIGRGHRGGGKRPREFSAEMERLFAEMKCLNRVDDRAARRTSLSSDV